MNSTLYSLMEPKKVVSSLGGHMHRNTLFLKISHEIQMSDWQVVVMNTSVINAVRVEIQDF